jgi:hypothetical protein
MLNDDELNLLARSNPVPNDFATRDLSDLQKRTTLERITATHVARQHGRKRSKILVAALIGVVVAVLTPVAIAVAPKLLGSHASNEGKPSKLTALQARRITRLDLGRSAHDWRLLGERGGVAFFIGSTDTGGSCLALFLRDRAAHPAALQCSSGPWRLLQRPGTVLDYSAARTSPALRGARLTRMVGLASDDVARVGVVTEDGDVVWAEVKDNLYGLDPVPETAVTRIIAENKSGDQIFHEDLTGTDVPG